MIAYGNHEGAALPLKRRWDSCYVEHFCSPFFHVAEVASVRGEVQHRENSPCSFALETPEMLLDHITRRRRKRGMVSDEKYNTLFNEHHEEENSS